MFQRGTLAAAMAVFALAAQPAAARSPASAPDAAGLPALTLGAAWYPEQWPEARWDQDLALMEAAHIRWVRITEFAWSALEPSEGVYDFGWLDRAIAAAARHHIYVVLGTPSAAPPAWLTKAYPDTLRVNENGSVDEHGGRQQFSFTSPRYRDLARAIAERMAERYGQDKRVVGWQIDNEISAVSFDAVTKQQFQEWLKAKYGDVATLNARWTTAYWSQTYDSFGEIPMHTSGENPGLALDLRRFWTDVWASYVENQASAIRAHKSPAQFVTTNSMNWNDSFDQYKVHAGLDIAAWDEYIPSGHPDWPTYAAQHDSVRGYKGKNFWIMETEPAFVNWWSVNRALQPGEMREMIWQAVGHGADAVGFWQWRSALNGQEQYHGVLVGADGEPAPAYAVAQGLGADFGKAAPYLAGTTPKAKVAFLNSYDSRWALDYQKHTIRWDSVGEFVAFHRSFESLAQSVDVISADAPVDGYSVVVAPSLNVVTDDEAKRLINYVNGGGHLVLGPRSGMKDAFNALQTKRQPGPLVDLLGGRAEQFYALDEVQHVAGALGDGRADIWAEVLSSKSPDTEVLMRYIGDPSTWLGGQPAVLTRKLGKGSITYVGAWLDDVLMRALAKRELDAAGVAPKLAGVPDGVEVCERQGPHGRVLILINHTNTSQSVTLPGAMRDVLGGGTSHGAVTIAAHDVAVYAEG
jgi:beta-galactosidase